MNDSSGPTAKRRKLQPLVAQNQRKEDAAAHQGRVRTVPHVDGIFPSQQCQAAHPDVRATDGPSLRLSLSKTLYLRAHETDKVRDAVRSIAAKISSFEISFDKLIRLTNEDKTRSFLARRVAAGAENLTAILAELHVVLRKLRLPLFYDPPIFHASFAWRVLLNAEQVGNAFSDTELDEANAEHGSALRKDIHSVTELCFKCRNDVQSFNVR
ncbi:uncharacterized protein L969DRAFT_95489 [Mixia osmundae IAM 14324]|uniref:U6 snRNA phosphodiesterase 1 n=1 Tax=Mixia osmundae (strain CBS 9802 / IAM 14324 / JCM 22182 / KY 12970) TaxID=764103 RepID=G7E7J7_MIXOS|nr:uncharacterized protein L969DRAFT_95489 [Mixia osmundae IAM 14324]KEI38409.1 hypothetical protein L969DRAFT_95489 [Mixia osmundae IAM 14324]GAA98807.1 hypothetical protein E5Q_05495 [Mixia osmundae IAM 14324]